MVTCYVTSVERGSVSDSHRCGWILRTPSYPS